MARKEKHHVFSSRTTEEGLKALNELKAKLGVSWDALVIDAVCAHYGLDRGVMAVPPKPKAEKKTEVAKPKKAKARKKPPKKGSPDKRPEAAGNGQPPTDEAAAEQVKEA